VKIRAITYFLDLEPVHPDSALGRAGKFLHEALNAYQQAGITVQSRRVATQPYPRMGIPARDVPGLAKTIRTLGDAHELAYISLGPASATDETAYLDVLPDVFAAAEGLFTSITIASRERGIDLGLLRHTADVVRRVSTVTADGLTNLYLCASANVRPGAPFFPAAYHGGGADQFALAIEAADLAVAAAQKAADPADFVRLLAEAINTAAQTLVPVAEQLAQKYTVGFGGLDFSLAPYPGQATSLAGAMEHLGVIAGGGGMVAAAALVMNAIEAARFPRCGFSGLMLPVLEDTTLGERAAENALDVNDLLLYSAICGTGLDCIPLPGDTDTASLSAILLDTAALALRLDKPLTARLMPIPGAQVGDPVRFPHFEYFVPARVMRPLRTASTGVLTASATFGIQPRR